MEDHINNELEEFNENRTLTESTLRKRRDTVKKSIPLVDSGSNTALTPKQEKQYS